MQTGKPIELHGQPVAGGKFPLICTPLVGRTRDQILAEVQLVLAKKPDILEWRVDFFEGMGTPQKSFRRRHASKQPPVSAPCCSRDAPSRKAAKKFHGQRIRLWRSTRRCVRVARLM